MHEYKEKRKTDQIYLLIIACVIITGNLTCRAVGVKFLSAGVDRTFIGVAVIEGGNRSSEIAPRDVRLNRK